jgi:hypothetical protein
MTVPEDLRVDTDIPRNGGRLDLQMASIALLVDVAIVIWHL